MCETIVSNRASSGIDFGLPTTAADTTDHSCSLPTGTCIALHHCPLVLNFHFLCCCISCLSSSYSHLYFTHVIENDIYYVY